MSDSAPDLFQPPQSGLVLTPCQSLALRRLVDVLKADDAIYSACPEIVRRSLAGILLPAYTSAEAQIAALEAAVEENLKLLERFGSRIQELERRRPTKHSSGEQSHD